MADNKAQVAKEIYNSLCDAIDKIGWKYDKEEDKLLVHFAVSGEDIPMKFIMFVDEDRQLLRLISYMPFKMSEAKRYEGAVAACVSSYGLIDGSFDYDITDGEISFRMVQPFMDGSISESTFMHMISFSCSVVDDYNDRFMALDKGFMSIEEFIQKG